MCLIEAEVDTIDRSITLSLMVCLLGLSFVYLLTISTHKESHNNYLYIWTEDDLYRKIC